MFDGHRAAVSDQCAVANAKLVAFGVSPEIVVIVENQDGGLVASEVAIEMGCSETADARSHDDQIVDFAGGLRLAGLSPRLAIAQTMRVGKGAVVISAHAREGRGIIAGSFFGRVTRFVKSQRRRRNHCAANAECNSVEEVATRDGTIHPQIFFATHIKGSAVDYTRRKKSKSSTLAY